MMQEVTYYSKELLPQLQSLINQLMNDPKILTAASITKVIEAENSHLYLLKHGDNIIAMLTLIENEALSGKKIWVEDVVVDNNHRKKGFGKAIMLFAEQESKRLGADSINLTSKPDKKEANILYQNVGYKRRETNIYRIDPNSKVKID